MDPQPVIDIHTRKNQNNLNAFELFLNFLLFSVSNFW